MLGLLDALALQTFSLPSLLLPGPAGTELSCPALRLLLVACSAVGKQQLRAGRADSAALSPTAPVATGSTGTCDRRLLTMSAETSTQLPPAYELVAAPAQSTVVGLSIVAENRSACARCGPASFVGHSKWVQVENLALVAPCLWRLLLDKWGADCGLPTSSIATDTLSADCAMCWCLANLRCALVFHRSTLPCLHGLGSAPCNDDTHSHHLTPSSPTSSHSARMCL